MRPILFRVAGWAVPSHEVFAGLGILIALFITWRLARRRGRADLQLLYLVAGGLAGAAIFARFGLVFRYLQAASDPSLAGMLRFGGRTLLGGLVGGYLGIVATKRLIGYRRATGDVFAPGVALGMGVGRVGCYLAERPGTITTVPWGVRVPPDAVPYLLECPGCGTGATMHPSFVYEMAFDLAAFAVLIELSLRPRPPVPWMKEGDVFKAFLLSYAVFRFFVEYVRGNPVMALGLSGSQIMAALSTVALGLYFVRRRRLA